MRVSGYYWVKVRDSSWEIAYYYSREGRWSSRIYGDNLYDDNFSEIDEKEIERNK